MTGTEAPTDRFTAAMSDAEALMWNIEKDPWLSSTMGTLLILDRPIDPEHLRRRISGAIAAIPRLRERAMPRLGRFAPPAWYPDGDFELGYHLRHLSVPGLGSRDQLLELVTRLLQDPFDRTRPLWQFIAIDGLEGGAGAMLIKLHHTLTDGAGAVKVAEQYMDLAPNAPLAPEVDLVAVLADAVRKAQQLHRDPNALGQAAKEAATHTLRQRFGALRRLATEAALTAADPERLTDTATSWAETAQSMASQLLAESHDSAGSQLWSARSRQRQFLVADVDQATAANTAKALGGSLNDLFVTAAVLGADVMHREAGEAPEHFSVTFIVSTREDRSTGGNAFTPSKAHLPAHGLAPAELFNAVREVLYARREEVHGPGLLNSLAPVANLLPTTVLTRMARAQATNVDFATSNVRAAPFQVFIGQAKLLASYPVGPVAGTAFNLTMMSYNGTINLGLHADPCAVKNPKALLAHIVNGFVELERAATAI